MSALPLPAAELDVVEVLCAVMTDEGTEIPVGSRGTVVYVRKDGEGYTIEFIEPLAGLAEIGVDQVRIVWRFQRI